jgi:uncharacterized protein YjbJ (UPF0337 family)
MGNATGMTSMQNSGKQEHAEGEAEVKGAQAKGMMEGMMDRAMGMKDSIVGSVTGDQAQQASGAFFPLSFFRSPILRSFLLVPLPSPSFPHPRVDNQLTPPQAMSRRRQARPRPR